jgi:transcriptional regulator with XRE-family HTH domain
MSEPTATYEPTENGAATQTRTERLGALIRELRDIRGWTQEELADRAGVAVSTISTCERGKYALKIDSLCKVASAFDVAPSKLIAEIE